jgi:lysophospholipase L1-like esterase
MTRTSLAGKAVQGLCLTLALLTMWLSPARAEAAGPDTRKWYLAEGAFNSVFDENILIGNPNAAAVKIQITLLPSGGTPIVLKKQDLGALSRMTVNLGKISKDPAWYPAPTPVPEGAYSAIVECTDGCASPEAGIVVERTMTTLARGGHTSQGVTTLSKDWFLAEGATGFFNTFILIGNPSAQTATVTLTYLLEDKAAVVQHVKIAAGSRRTVYVNNGVCDQEIGQDESACTAPETKFLSGQAFSTKIESDVDVAVERAMYWNAFNVSGHASAGVVTPDPTWLFAEGVTGGGGIGWSTFFLVVNPSATTNANLTATFLIDGRPQPIVCAGVATAGHRLTIDASNLAASLKDKANPAVACDASKLLGSGALFATKIESDQPIVAERTVYFSTGGVFWVDGHNTPGVNAAATKWAFAEGGEGVVTPGSGVFYESYFLLQNPNAYPLTLQATFVREDGRGLVWKGTVPALQRFTIPAGSFPELIGRRFATFIEPQTPADATQTFVAERTMYWGTPFYGGTGATGTPWLGTIGTLPASQVIDLTPAVTSIEPNRGLVGGGKDVTIYGDNFVPGFTTVTFDGVAAQNVHVIDRNQLTLTTPAHATGAVDVKVTNSSGPSSTPPPGGWVKTVAGGFTYVSDAPPHLTVQFAMGFGDSITHGVTSRVCMIGTLQTTCSFDIVGYPQRVQDILRGRYPTVDPPFLIENQGLPGELAVDGENRYDTVVNGGHQLLVLLEGVNDLNAGVTISAVADALREIVRSAKAHGKKVIIMRLPPGKPKETDGQWKAPDPARVASLNSAIETLASQEGLPTVDLTAAFGSNYQALLSPDGLHPNEAGYQKIAEAVAQKIIDSYEVR